MIYTIIYHTTTLKIEGFASFETTRENLGNYPIVDYVLQHVTDPDFPIATNYKVVLENAEIVGTEEIPPVVPTPPVFEPCNPIMGVEPRLERVENFLCQLYPPPS